MTVDENNSARSGFDSALLSSLKGMLNRRVTTLKMQYVH
jgi:hypothetical protein